MITVSGETLPEAWENAVLAVWKYGISIPTEYDQPIDPDSRDATVTIVVADPFAEPRIHASLPCSLEDLEVYRQEVVAGIHNDNIKKDGWPYGYNDRMFNWPGRDAEMRVENLTLPHINQINALVEKLARTPYSRRAQAITWFPPVDAFHHEPPCLQRIWCRVVKSGDSAHLLEMNTHWRSRDIFKAALMNMFAFTDLQRVLASEVSRLSGLETAVGRYVDISDSGHIYGQYIRKGEMERFVHAVENLPFEKRTFRSDDPRVQRAFSRAPL